MSKEKTYTINTSYTTLYEDILYNCLLDYKDEVIKNNRALGEPEGTGHKVMLDRVSHLVTDIFEEDGELKGKTTLLDIDLPGTGKMMQELTEICELELRPRIVYEYAGNGKRKPLILSLDLFPIQKEQDDNI